MFLKYQWESCPLLNRNRRAVDYGRGRDKGAEVICETWTRREERPKLCCKIN